jgi:hypothetical protein
LEAVIIVMIVKQLLIIKINRNAKKKIKNTNVKFVMEKLIQVKLLKLQNGLIVINVLDGFKMKNVLKIMKIMEHVKQFGNVRSARKFYYGKILIQIIINVEKRSA